ncbi:MAG: zinc-dependent alcohol dehydrogenase [Acidimicrobiales bacterium]
MLSTRRRVLVSAPDVVEVVSEPVPELAPGEALVRLSVCGICGSDKAGYHGEHVFCKPPYYPGHEVVGVVVEVGGAVEGVAVGDRVTVEPTLICGHCKPCLNGAENLCENLEFFGCGYREGGMADVFAVRADRLHKVPSSFTDFQAALIEPLATPVHAVRLVGNVKGKAVAVLGAGTIGLLTLVAARHAGAKKIVSTDQLANKRQMALELGADAVVDAAREDVAEAVRGELGESADVVFDCVSHQDTLDSAIKMAVKGGTVGIVGGPRRPAVIDHPVVQEFQIRLQGCATYRSEDFHDAMAIIGSGAFSAERLVTATFTLPKAPEAFAAIDSGREGKILVLADAQ